MFTKYLIICLFQSVGTLVEMRSWLESWKQRCQDQTQTPGTPVKRGGDSTPLRRRLMDRDWGADECSRDSFDSGHDGCVGIY